MQLTDLLTLLVMNESQLYLKPSLQHFSQEAFAETVLTMMTQS